MDLVQKILFKFIYSLENFSIFVAVNLLKTYRQGCKRLAFGRIYDNVFLTFGVGGIDSPLVTVRFFPLLPPLVIWPDPGALSPGE